jgi:hypothetical protein
MVINFLFGAFGERRLCPESINNIRTHMMKTMGSATEKKVQETVRKIEESVLYLSPL